MQSAHLRQDDVDNDRTWFRSDRFFTADNQYYFSTREDIDVGPFPDRNSAQRGLDLYIQVMQKEEMAGLYASKIAMQGLWASTGYH